MSEDRKKARVLELVKARNRWGSIRWRGRGRLTSLLFWQSCCSLGLSYRVTDEPSHFCPYLHSGQQHRECQARVVFGRDLALGRKELGTIVGVLIITSA